MTNEQALKLIVERVNELEVEIERLRVITKSEFHYIAKNAHRKMEFTYKTMLFGQEMIRRYTIKTKKD